ncbi:hypothetical protein AVEN_102066-1 [Araneus ventricosus]|uniref:Uncharacterized protein n=1 Tax=Araneus ventricosus TaxID=182803 RepID=A0A4Y2WTT9_ARAVE|nr:hypothetical protein AVEN_102066-1 [Araneus ventricosus]
MYTLPKCGLPVTKLPSTDDKANVYSRANFLEIDGVCTLRVSLDMRDRWKRIFISRRNSSGFNSKTIPLFLAKTAVCCPPRTSNTPETLITASFALCNEIIMFFHHEDIGIDLYTVIDATSMNIIRVILEDKTVPAVADWVQK